MNHVSTVTETNMCGLGLGTSWRRVLLLYTHNMFGVGRVCKRCRGRGAKCHFSGNLHVGVNTRDPQGIPQRHRVLELPLCFQNCVVDMCADAACSRLMSNTYDCSGLRVRHEQQAKPGELWRREERLSDVSCEAVVGADTLLM